MGLRGTKTSNRFKVSCDYHKLEYIGMRAGCPVEISITSFPSREVSKAGAEPINHQNYSVALEDMPQRMDFRQAGYAYVMTQPEFSDCEVVLEEGQELEVSE